MRVSAEGHCWQGVLVGELDLDLRADVVAEELLELGHDEADAAHEQEEVGRELDRLEHPREVRPSEGVPSGGNVGF